MPVNWMDVSDLSFNDERHEFLVSRGFRWGRFEEPRSGVARKYWKTV
jgi:hypothetical protein